MLEIRDLATSYGKIEALRGVSLAARAGDIYAGLWYPIAVALLTVVVGGLFLRDTRAVSLED